MQDTIRFLNVMFPPELLEGGHKMAIWCLPSKAVAWFSEPELAARYALDQSSKQQNVYFGLGVQRSPPAHGRGGEADVTAITSLYLDIDIDDGEVKRGKGSLPTTRAEARKIIEAMGLPPSVLVDSGHGYQAYWVFKEPEILDDDAARAKTKTLTRAWNATARVCAGHLKFQIDSTFDLARVFRLPGTKNWKGADPKECRLLMPERGEETALYDPENDFDMFIAPEAYAPDAGARRPMEPVAPVMPRDLGGVPQIVLDHCENDPKFKATWERRRKDCGDGSASSYDLSIAAQLVACGATDQVIADAILAWRVKHGQNPEKARRRDYLMRTIGRARDGALADRAMNEVLELAEDVAMGGGGDLPPWVTEAGDAGEDGPEAGEGAESPVAKPESPEKAAKRADVMGRISKALGVGLTEVIKHGVENSIYSFTLAGGADVAIGHMPALMNADHVRSRVADATGVVMRPVKKENWLKTVSVILTVVTLRDNKDSTRRGMIMAYLTSYLQQHNQPTFSGEGWAQALFNRDPFVRDGRIHVHLSTLRKFIRVDAGDDLRQADLFDMMRLVGFTCRDVMGRHMGKVFCRSCWSIPENDASAHELVEAMSANKEADG